MTFSPFKRLPTLLLSLGLAVWISACGTLDRPDGPLRLTNSSLVPVQDPRILISRPQDLERFNTDIGNHLKGDRPTNILALSGGGANGAYGAGLLIGWTESGERPVFNIVTGVSTGALAAPFAFAGPEWDPHLQRAYTSGAIDGLLSWRTFAGFLYPSLFSNRVLKSLVDENVTPELMEAIAREHRTGRRLLVATTDLDSQETVIWDMGLLAEQGDENSYELFKQVLIASASIPGVFPPVLIPALQPDNTVVLTMHVDGGVNAPFLAIPESLMLWTRNERYPTESSLYVIVNGQAGRNFGVTSGNLTGILMRTYDSMSKSSLNTLLSATAAFADRNGLRMMMAAIPDNIVASSLRFDQESMTALFELGRRQALSGHAWTRLNRTHDLRLHLDANTIAEEDIPEALRIKEDASNAHPVAPLPVALEEAVP